MEVRIDVRLVGRKFLPRRRSDSTVRLCCCRCCSRLKAGLDLNETIEEQIMKHDSEWCNRHQHCCNCCFGKAHLVFVMCLIFKLCWETDRELEKGDKSMAIAFLKRQRHLTILIMAESLAYYISFCELLFLPYCHFMIL
ncbi:hypothetical protein Nepgr_012163 [Nepenthes gracilis]|uniref:Uncharacterized protein n=1 Tax=Nepenthes gracilis TaxID=150966 RepID=A0AAD3SGT9_NEPGR|nr:hypothetical protein Nepgr_012163 [Nepenthes gracilis]